MWLQKSDPIFNMSVDIMGPPFNFEPKYRDTMLTREEWTRGPWTSPTVKGTIWYTDGSRMLGGEPWAESLGNLWAEG